MKVGNFAEKSGYLFSVLIDYLFVFITIIQCNSVFYREGNNLKKIQFIWIMLLLFIFFRSIFRLALSKKNIVRLALFWIIFVTIMVVILTIDYQVMPFPKTALVVYLIAPLMLVTVFYEAISSNKKNMLLMYYKNVVIVISVISLLFWSAAMLGLPTNMNTFITWGNYHQIPGYFSVHYLAQGTIGFLGLRMIRNTGMFVEAPMYSYVLSIALLIVLFNRCHEKEPRIAELLIILLTIFTTASTTGVILAILAIAYDRLFMSKVLSPLVKLIIIALGVSIVGILIRIILIRKVNLDGTASANIRLNDIQAGFYAWKNNLLFGNGFGNYAAITTYMSPDRLMVNGNSGFSSGLMEVLAYGGLMSGLFYVVPTVLVAFRSKKMLGLAALTFLLFAFTIVNNVYIYTMLLSYFWAIIISKKKIGSVNYE